MTFYIEGKTGKIKGKIRSYNMLVDYAERTVLGDLSYKTLVEVNCRISVTGIYQQNGIKNLLRGEKLAVQVLQRIGVGNRIPRQCYGI